MSSCGTTLIVMATILGPVTLVFMAVSFGTDYWLRYEVDRQMLTAEDKKAMHNRYSHTRYRGLFRECYPGNDTVFLDSEPDVVDDFCFKVKYEMPKKLTDKSAEFLVRTHLLRLFLAFFIVALVFFVAAFCFGLILCCWRAPRWGYIAGLFAFISAFSVATAIAFFHGAEYLERNKIDDEGFYMKWPEGIQQATTRSYGWSYALGWVAMILATLTATFYSVAGCYIASSRFEERDRLEKDPYRGGFPLALESRYAMDDPYLIKPQPVYAEYPYAYQGPYIMAAAADTPRYRMTPPSTPQGTWDIREVSG